MIEMNFPEPTDFIDIHTHNGKTLDGVYFIENLMAHEDTLPEDVPGKICSFGIHPWYLSNKNIDSLVKRVTDASGSSNLIAVGEAGFDKLRGPSKEIQNEAFNNQIYISEKIKKPVIIHCVRAWDDLISEHKKLKPKMPWLIHGFRGKTELARQLLSKGMYLSFWFDFALRSESSKLFRALPKDKIFLETDGADVDIREIYKKVARDLDFSIDQLKSVIHANFNEFFGL